MYTDAPPAPGPGHAPAPFPTATSAEAAAAAAADIDRGTAVQCPRCGGVVPGARLEAHARLWCPAAPGDGDVEG